MQQITAILYFAGAAIAYELVLTKLFPDVPALDQIIGVISRSTGTLIRYFTGSILLAATIYSIKGIRKERTAKLEAFSIDNQ
jgi:hypothetical protein